MGGSVFARAVAPGAAMLRTPRMTPKQYEAVKERWQERLDWWFEDHNLEPEDKLRVSCAIEAPEKADYGDVNFFISDDADEPPVNFEVLASRLGATGVVVHSRYKASFAVLRDDDAPWSEPDPSHRALVYSMPRETRDDDRSLSVPFSTEAYTQIDIEMVPSDLAPWHSFYTANGDMIPILGHIVKAKGFSINDRGLFLRLEELEEAKEKGLQGVVADSEGLLFLSNNVFEVLGYLCLSQLDGYEDFETVDQLFNWISTCRLLDLELEKRKRATESGRDRKPGRKMYGQFFDEWLPEHEGKVMRYQSKIEREARWSDVKTREEYAWDAIHWFQRKEDFIAQRHGLKCAIGNAKATRLLRPIIEQVATKSQTKVNEILRAFRRHVGWPIDNVQPRILDRPRADRDALLYEWLDCDGNELREPALARDWIENYWRMVLDEVKYWRSLEDGKKGVRSGMTS